MKVQAVLFKNIKWTALEKLGGQVLSFLVFLLLARLLDPAAFGLVGMALVYISFINIFIEQGFSDALIQRENLEPLHLDTIFWLNIGIGIILTVGSIILSPFIAALFHEPKLQKVVLFLSFNLILSAIGGTQQAILRREMNFKSLGLRTIAGRICGGGVGVTGAFMGCGVWSLVAQQLVASLVSVVLLWSISSWRPGLHFSLTHFKELASFSYSMICHKIVGFVDTKSDNFIIGYFLGPVMLGYYIVAYRIFEALNSLVIGVITPAIFPVFARLQNDRDRLKNIFMKGTKLVSILVFPVYLGVSILGSELITTLFGEKWSPSIPVLQILAVAGLLQVFLGLNGSLVIALGKPQELLKIRLAATAVILIAFMLVVNRGIVAVAWVYMICNYILIAPFHFRLVFSLLELDWKRYFMQFYVAVACVTLMLLSVAGVKYVDLAWLSDYGQLVIYVVTGIVVYVGGSYIMYPSIFTQLTAFAKQDSAFK